MYVEYDSVRDLRRVPPAAFLGALADFLDGVLAILIEWCESCICLLERVLTGALRSGKTGLPARYASEKQFSFQRTCVSEA